MKVGDLVNREGTVNSATTTIEDFILRLKKVSAGWTRVRIGFEAYEEYGDYCEVKIAVRGKSPATQDDVDKNIEDLSAHMTQQEICDRNNLRSILARNPDAIVDLRAHDEKKLKFEKLRKQKR